MKEFKQIGGVKCPICGEMIPVRETNSKSQTPWIACNRCHNRCFFNGAEGQEIRKHLQEGHRYTTNGGLEFLPIQTQKAETRVSDENMSDFDIF